jgi:hypothetical protein
MCIFNRSYGLSIAVDNSIHHYAAQQKKHDDDDVQLDKLQTKGVKKSILYM